jgi:hypothetical protein
VTTTPEGEWKRLAPADGKLGAQLAAEVQAAAAGGRVACVYLHAAWAPPCVAIKKSLAHPLMQDALRGVRVVEIDIDSFGPNDRQLESCGIEGHTVPAFFRLDGHARVVDKVDGGAWGANTPENFAPKIRALFR